MKIINENKKFKTIILTGGGTAGHIKPNMALIPQLKKHFDRIVYIGSKNGMEKDMLKAYSDIVFYSITTTKLVRKFTLKNLLIPFKLIKSIYESKNILKKERPNIIFSKGGYVALPVVLASKNIPVIAHESDLKLGLANRIIYKKCKIMCTNFEETAKSLAKGKWTGTPFEKSNSTPLEFGNFDAKLPTILIIGGSLGSEIINNTVRECLPQLVKIANIIHIVGKDKMFKTSYEDLNYSQFDFIPNMDRVYPVVNFAISRAGANVVTELLRYSIPAILIPLGTAESRGDQIDNAKYIESKGLAKLLLEKNLDTDLLLVEIEKLINSESEYIKKLSETKFPDSNDLIISFILKNARRY